MCYFDHTLWPCGYWKWGTFRAQCNKEYRTGETCGLKLIFNTYLERDVCKMCDTMHTKQRRLAKMADDVRRWRGEGNRHATIEKTEREMIALNIQIGDLWVEHTTRKNAINY